MLFDYLKAQRGSSFKTLRHIFRNRAGFTYNPSFHNEFRSRSGGFRDDQIN
ncbi:hypothetical protein HanIR_Chr15g0739891 [Helianthus annuus]|nr:hypothetical protein HanIR_Chr15g0739891 [Helianthus annuus]